ncbi:MAG TPA: EamA family transporter [Bacteroidales bacterium]|nr:EamA family transporter [Bacteroidales bacterium]
MEQYYGELAALLTAVFWTVTALAFESASRKVGSLSVNLLRLGTAFIFLSVYALISRGKAFPVDAGAHQWIWLSLSGLVGFVLGDLFLFQSYVVIGSRISMLIMSLAPPMAAIIGWLTMDETLTLKQAIAMAVVLAGIVLVVLERQAPDENGNGKRMRFTYPITGILLAFGGALGQAGGLVLSKYGMDGYDVIPSVQIRVITGIAGFMIFFTLSNKWRSLIEAVHNGKAMKRLLVGSFFGPFLGVSFSLLAVKYTSTGVASALMSIVPVLIIAPAIIVFKEKITVKELIGAIVTVVGVAIFFL